VDRAFPYYHIHPFSTISCHSSPPQVESAIPRSCNPNFLYISTFCSKSKVDNFDLATAKAALENLYELYKNGILTGRFTQDKDYVVRCDALVTLAEENKDLKLGGIPFFSSSLSVWSNGILPPTAHSILHSPSIQNI